MDRRVLAPDVATAPAGVVPILFLDSFSVHLKGSVVNKIQDLGVQVEFIPPGCTGLLQPVDVGFNKAFKAKLRTEYNGWLLEQDPDLPIPGTTRCDVSNWIIAAEKGITEETLQNSQGTPTLERYPPMANSRETTRSSATTQTSVTPTSMTPRMRVTPKSLPRGI